MKSGRGIVEIFGRCSRLLNKIALNIEDGFFFQLCAKESDKLLSEFIFFLRGGGERHNVAQSGEQLISQIKNIFNLLDIIKHLGLAKPPTPLLLEKNLLLLKLSVLNTCQSTARLVTEAEKPAPLKIKKTGLRRLHKINPPKLGQTHQEVLEFIKSQERTQNLEVFSRFSHIGRRTLKRKLSELIKAGAIKRLTVGKKVFYAAL